MSYLDFAPGEFVDVGKTETAEATEQERLLDVVLGGVFCVDYCFDLVESEVFTLAFLGTGTEAAVHVLAGVSEYDAFSFSFV